MLAAGHSGDGLTILYSVVFLAVVCSGLGMLRASIRAWVWTLATAGLLITALVVSLH